MLIEKDKIMENMTDNVEPNVNDSVDIKVPAQELLAEQEISALRRVHEFLSAFDRVPGSMSAQWSQMLDTVAVVANSLIAKLPKTEEQPESQPEENKE
jgi:hypothetical protein